MSVKEWWLELTLQERRLIQVGSVILSVLLGYLYLWSPLDSRLDSDRQAIQQQQELLQWMQPAQVKIQHLKADNAGQQSVSSDILPEIIDRSIKNSSFATAVAGFRQTSNGRVSAQFKAIPFDPLISWLINLGKLYPIQIDQLTIHPLNTKGTVDVDLVLKIES